MVNLFELLNFKIKIKPEKCKIHLATHNGSEDPLDVFLHGKFDEWQAWQTHKNFVRDYVIGLIKYNKEWLFAGLYKCFGCDYHKDKEEYKYHMEKVIETKDFDGRLILKYDRKDRQPYRNAETLYKDIYLLEIKSEMVKINNSPDYKNANPENEKKIEIKHNTNDSSNKTSYKRKFELEDKEYQNIHGQLQDSFLSYLRNRFPKEKISKEASLKGLNRSIDIYHEKSNGEKIIYEIKAYNDVKNSLRVAIGQLLEYAYYPQRKKKFNLYPVTHKIADDELKSYLENLKSLFSIDVGYIGFDIEKKNIIDNYDDVCFFQNL